MREVSDGVPLRDRAGRRLLAAGVVLSSQHSRSSAFVGVWPKAGIALAIVAVGMAVGVGLATLLTPDSTEASADPTEMASECASGTETLDIAADPAVVPIVRQLAERYTNDLVAAGRECIPIYVRPVTASAVAGRLANGWRSQTHGPRPDVWIPKSTLWVELLRASIDDESILPEDPTVLARSPTVIAMPRPMAEKLGWPDQQLSWSELYQMADSKDGWAQMDMPQWGTFRFELTDPRYTTTGLQALLALDEAQEQQTASGGTTLDLFRIQRALANIDASSTETLSRYVRADNPLRSLSAMPLEEREVWRFNETGSPSSVAAEESESAESGSAASEPTAGEDLPDLVAMYPSGTGDIAMESDYPYVLLDTSWVSDDVLQFADEFGDYLISDTGVEMFTAAGFRTRDNEAGEQLAANDHLQAMDAVAQAPPGDLPEIRAFRQLRRSWVTVPRVSRTLFLIDVSGSMQVLVPGTQQTRLQATVRAAKESLEIIPGGSDVGLWEFSTDLPGGQGGGDYQELEPLAPLSEVRGGKTHRERLIDALNAIDPENDTALNDTLLAAYEQLRNSYITGRRHLIVLLTDGRNDDDESITQQQLIVALQRLHRAQEPIQVVSIAYGEQPDLDNLAEISETVGGRVVSSPKLQNLERLFIKALAR